MAPLIIALALIVSLIGPPAAGFVAQSAGCQFVLGFQALHDLDPADVGDCVDDQAYAANGDAQQHTTKGLLAWRKADNWTAFTDGYWTWINGPNGLAKRLNTQRFSWEANPEHLPLADAPPPVVPGIQPVQHEGLVDTTLDVPAGYRVGVFAAPHTLQLPPGFHIAVFAAGLPGPRGLAFSPQGDLYASLESAGRVVALPDRAHAGVASQVVTVASGLENPFGLAFAGGALYVGETTRIGRFSVDPGTLRAAAPTTIVAGLPAGGRHVTRTVHVGPDGKLYVSIGSSCDVCVERDARRATIMQFNLDGTGGRIYARGMRNAVGFAFAPDTGLLWATVNGQDGLGDNLPGEDVTVVRDGDNFGWPYCYGDQQPDPQVPPPTPGYCAATTAPTLQLPAHMAPLGAAFATGSQLPPAIRGSLVIGLHGSIFRSGPVGYKLVVVGMQASRPTGVSDFATGWLTGSGSWGRPVDVAQGPDGALYVSDGAAGAIYRIWYGG